MRSHDYYEHPVFLPFELLIRSPAMSHIQEKLTCLIWNGATGAVIEGEARHGKTTALEFIQKKLCSRDGEIIPSHWFTVPSLDRQTINATYRSLLVSADLRVTNAMRVEPMISNLISYILDKVSKSKNKRFILIADEGQRLSPKQCDVFSQLHDCLRKQYKIHLCLILIVNTDEAKHLIELVQHREYRHVYGRFFTNRMQFHGLRNVKEVKDCLKQYDTLRYPYPNGPTYTEYFLPEPYSSGWRYANASSCLWKVFSEYRREYMLEYWGMQYFINTVNTLLIDFLPKYSVENLSPEMVRRAIGTSGLVPGLVRARA